MEFIAKNTVALRSGSVIPAGAKIELRWGKCPENIFPRAFMRVNGGEEKAYKARVVAPLMNKRIPSENTLRKWSFDGVAKSIMGKKVEPDGYDEYGSPSWLVALGLM